MPTALVLTKATSYSHVAKAELTWPQHWLTALHVFYISAEDLSNFVTKFQWDTAKYPVKQSLRNLTEIISKVCMSIFSVTIMPLL